MSQEPQIQESRGWDSTSEPIGAELWRLWTSEIKPHFKAEAEFLQKYAESSGYPRDYVGRVLTDHRLMEELVWMNGDEGVTRFARVLAAHIRFKQDFFSQMVSDIVEGDSSAEKGD